MGTKARRPHVQHGRKVRLRASARGGKKPRQTSYIANFTTNPPSPPSSPPFSPPPQSLTNTTAFYQSNSYNKLNYEFYIHRQVITLDVATYGQYFTVENCGNADILTGTGTEMQEGGSLRTKVLEQIAGTELEGVVFDNFGTIVPYCSWRPWAGVGSVGGMGWTDMWGPDPRHDRVIAHEIGHNIGTRHDSFGAIEYGSPFTVMGHGPIPEAHMYGAAKHLFEWMPYDRVKIVGNVDNLICKASQHCETFDYDEKITVDLHPIDGDEIDPSDSTKSTLVKIPISACKLKISYQLNKTTHYDSFF